MVYKCTRQSFSTADVAAPEKEPSMDPQKKERKKERKKKY